MESMRIKPTSPIQTRAYLNPDEEVLFIGTAKEKINKFDKLRWIALTDQGRFLIFQSGKESNGLNRSMTINRSGTTLSKEKSKEMLGSKAHLGLISPIEDVNSKMTFSNGIKQKESLVIKSKVYLFYIGWF